MQYEDFEILFSSHCAGVYRVLVLNSPAGQTSAEVPISQELFSAVSSWSQRNSGACTVNGSPEISDRDLASMRPSSTPPNIKRLGSLLFDTLFAGEVRVCYDESRGSLRSKPDTGLRIKIHMFPNEADTLPLCSLPWELLFHERTRDFLSLDKRHSIIRYMDVPRAVENASIELPLRVGVLISGPSDLSQLDLDQEAGLIGSAWKRYGDVKFDLLKCAEIESFRKQLLVGNYNVFHFAGHGSFDLNGGSLVFEKLGRAQPANAEIISHLVRGIESIKLIFLNACRTGLIFNKQQTDPFAGLASSLILAGVPAVVAMQYPFSDRAALTFSSAFYSYLSSGASLDTAMTEGRLAILADNPASVEWGTPTLLTRLPNGNLFGHSMLGTSEENYKAGVHELYEHRPSRAEEHFKKALALDPKHFKAATCLCLCQMSEKPLISLPLSLAQGLNDRLITIAKSGDLESKYLAKLLLGILRYDFFLPRNLEPRELPSRGLFLELGHGKPDSQEKLLLENVYFSRKSALLFNLDKAG
jgi:hypothetical protein